MKSSEEAVILCKTSIGSLKLEINDLPATKVNAPKPASRICQLPHLSLSSCVKLCLWWVSERLIIPDFSMAASCDRLSKFFLGAQIEIVMGHNWVHMSCHFSQSVNTYSEVCAASKGRGLKRIQQKERRKFPWGTSHSGTSGATIECVNTEEVGTERVSLNTNGSQPLCFYLTVWVSKASVCLGFVFLFVKSEQNKPIHSCGPLVFWQKIIEEVEEMLNNLPGVTSVHGRFYDLSSKYYRIIGNHAAYYKDALRYLGCVDLKDLPGEAACRMARVSGDCRTVMAQSEGLLSPQRQRSRRGPSRWGSPASSEKESTTLGSWWGSRCCLYHVYSYFWARHTRMFSKSSVFVEPSCGMERGMVLWIGLKKH